MQYICDMQTILSCFVISLVKPLVNYSIQIRFLKNFLTYLYLCHLVFGLLALVVDYQL